jgi:hypothetical protein
MVDLHVENFQERRKGTRTSFVTRANLIFTDGQADLEGELQDISIFGMFIETLGDAVVGSSCSVRIVITAKNSRLVIDGIEGVIVRSAGRGVGIQFTSNMEWFVIFKVYTHFSKNGEELDAAALEEHLNIGNRRIGMAERRQGIVDRRQPEKN